MAKIVFLSVYDDVNIGVRILHQEALLSGHDSHVVFFKTPVFQTAEGFRENRLCYEYTVNSDFVIAHYDADPWTSDELGLLVQELNDLEPDIIALSCRSWFDSIAEEFVSALRNGVDGAPLIVAGGYGPAFSLEYYLSFTDYVFIGECEDALPYFLDRFTELDSRRSELKNIAYMEDGRVVKQNILPLERDVSSYEREIFIEEASVVYKGQLLKIDPLRGPHHKYFFMAGRGCVGTCSYCSGGYWRNLYPTNVKMRRNRSLDSIYNELDRVKAEGFEFIHFVDEFFVFPYRDLVQIFGYMKDNIQIPFFCYLHPKVIVQHPDVLELAVQAGLASTIVAVQSGSDTFSREVYNRRNDYETILRFAELVHSYEGLGKTYHFITANPLETKEDIFASFDYIKQLPFNIGVDTIHAFKLNIFPQSPLGDMIAGKDLPTVSTKRAVFLGFMHYIRILVDDEEFAAIYDKYVDQDPFLLQPLIHDLEKQAKRLTQ